jgi:hypothetical protein
MLWNRVPDYRMAQLANIGLSIDNLTSQLLHRPHPAETVAPIFSKVYDVQIPPPETGSRQPIVVLGKDGAADYLLIQDLSSSNFRLAFDHWGFGGPQTGLISIPSCRKVRLHVIFDPNGRVAYAGIEGRATLLFYPIELYGWDAGNTFIGVNPYVGASATKKFAGTIQEVSPASVNRAANGTTNLALGKVVTQSSTGYANSGALLAVDGNTDGVFAKGSVTHTFPTANPWWEVDLGAVASIGSVQVWNRTDCCGQRLSDYWVFISEAPFAADDTPATLQVPCVWSNHQTSAPAPSMSISAGGIRGRYVRVQLAGSDTLSLAEVQVFGSMAPAVPTRSGCTL